MQLTYITLQGTMQGAIYWPVGEIFEMAFSQDFAAPKSPHSPWQIDWIDIDEALQRCLDAGDFQGGMGDLVCGSIIFHLAGNGRFKTLSKPLEDMKAAQRYLVKETEQ